MRFPKTEHLRQKNIRQMKAAGTYSKHPSPLPTEEKFRPVAGLRDLLRDFQMAVNDVARMRKMHIAQSKMEEHDRRVQNQRTHRVHF